MNIGNSIKSWLFGEDKPKTVQQHTQSIQQNKNDCIFKAQTGNPLGAVLESGNIIKETGNVLDQLS